jgi:hypothetical protein
MRVLYYHRDDIDDAELKVVLFILAVIIGVFWGLIHFLDWLTFDIVPWWAEPLAIIFFLPFFAMCMAFGANPMHWWPAVWGHKIAVDTDNFFWVLNWEELKEKYGGGANVYWGGQDYIKFRRKRDAFTYCLTNLRRG